MVTIVPQFEMVEFIGGDYVDTTVMVPAGQSPHNFEPTPEQMVKVAKAKAYFKVGSGIEFERNHMNTIIEQNPDLRIYDCSENIEVLSFKDHYKREKHQLKDIENNHDYEGTDPHIWTSPENFKKMAEVVYYGLIEIDPKNQKGYDSNFQTYISNLESLHKNISIMLKNYENKSFMVYHPAWGYFGDSYRLNMITIEEEGKQPGPVGIASIINQAKNENISVIFVAPQFDTSSAETIAEEINGTVVYANPLMTDYISALIQLTEDMISGFEK